MRAGTISRTARDITFPMKNKLITLVAFIAIPAVWAADEPAKLEKIMVTGSLAETVAAPEKLEKVLVTGSLAVPAAEPQKLEKIMVTGSLAEPTIKPEKLEKIMVTGSLETRPAKRESGHKR